jgi:hypothetical protein
MATSRDSHKQSSPAEWLLLAVLRQRGPRKLDSLCTLPEVGLSHALLAIDRLSGSGAVLIEHLG